MEGSCLQLNDTGLNCVGGLKKIYACKWTHAIQTHIVQQLLVYLI